MLFVRKVYSISENNELFDSQTYETRQSTTNGRIEFIVVEPVICPSHGTKESVMNITYIYDRIWCIKINIQSELSKRSWVDELIRDQYVDICIRAELGKIDTICSPLAHEYYDAIDHYWMQKLPSCCCNKRALRFIYLCCTKIGMDNLIQVIPIASHLLLKDPNMMINSLVCYIKNYHNDAYE